MFLYRDGSGLTAQQGHCEVIVAKLHAGPTGVSRLVFLDYYPLRQHGGGA